MLNSTQLLLVANSYMQQCMYSHAYRRNFVHLNIYFLVYKFISSLRYLCVRGYQWTTTTTTTCTAGRMQFMDSSICVWLNARMCCECMSFGCIRTAHTHTLAHTKNWKILISSIVLVKIEIFPCIHSCFKQITNISLNAFAWSCQCVRSFVHSQMSTCTNLFVSKCM